MDKSLRYDRLTINDYLANTLRMSKTRRSSLETVQQGRRLPSDEHACVKKKTSRTKQETRPQAHHTHAQENEEEAQRARQKLFTRALAAAVDELPLSSQKNIFDELSHFLRLFGVNLLSYHLLSTCHRVSNSLVKISHDGKHEKATMG